MSTELAANWLMNSRSLQITAPCVASKQLIKLDIYMGAETETLRMTDHKAKRLSSIYTALLF